MLEIKILYKIYSEFIKTKQKNIKLIFFKYEKIYHKFHIYLYKIKKENSNFSINYSLKTEAGVNNKKIVKRNQDNYIISQNFMGNNQ